MRRHEIYATITTGEHVFSVRSKTNPTNEDIPRMICSITLHEFGNEAEFHMDNDIVSAYPTWDVGRRGELIDEISNSNTELLSCSRS